MVFELERNSKALGKLAWRVLGGKVLRKGAEGGAGSLREELLGLVLLPGRLGSCGLPCWPRGGSRGPCPWFVRAWSFLRCWPLAHGSSSGTRGLWVLPPDAGRRAGGTLQGVEIVALGWRLGLPLLSHVALPESSPLTPHPVLCSLALPDTHLVAPLFPHSHQRQCCHSSAGTIVVFLGHLCPKRPLLTWVEKVEKGREPEPFLVETQAPPPALWVPPVFQRLCQCFTWVVSCSCCNLHKSAEKQTCLRSHRQSPLSFLAFAFYLRGPSCHSLCGWFLAHTVTP